MHSFIVALILCAILALLAPLAFSSSADQPGAEEKKQEFLILLTPARDTFPADATREEMQAVGEHFRRLQQGVQDGDVILAGRTQDAPPLGLVIIEAKDLVAAKTYAAEDPAVAANIFNAEVRPYAVALMRGRGG